MIDQLIVGLYLAVTLVIGLVVGKNTKTLKDFAIGNRDFSTLILLSAVFASLVEASDTMGLAGEVFTNGPIYVFSYLGVAFAHFTLAWFIAPKLGPYLGLLSSGDILERLYGRRAKTLMGFSTILESTLLAGAQILAISQISQYFFGISGDLAAIGVSALMVVYSFRGGIRSVTATDVFQFGIMIVAIPIVCAVGLIKAGGYSTVIELVKTHGVRFQKPGGITYGECAALFASFALPCLYPLCIQRMLMARNVKQIRNTFLLHGLVGIPFYLTVGLIGLVAFALTPDIEPIFALPNLINELLPVGLKGFVIAGLLAVFMSTIDSIFHMGSMAITHDAIGSLVKKPLSDDMQLRLARYSSIVISCGAILIAIRFTNIFDVIYLMMVFGNSVFFPGYLLGLTGFSNSKQGFWLGVLVGLTTAITLLALFDLHSLYVMLIAIAANMIVHVSYILANRRYPAFMMETLSSLTNSFSKLLKYVTPIGVVKNKDYCNIFSICSIGLSIYPFFILKSLDVQNGGLFVLFLNATIATLSFLLLFAELWWPFFAQRYALIWAFTIALALPTQTFFMFFKSGSGIWLMDAFVIVPLLAILSSRRSLIALLAFGVFLAAALAICIPFSPSSFSFDFGYSALVLHIVVLAICLALFRKRDVDMCRFAGSTLIHETKRALFTFENAAHYYEKRLPILVASYKKFVPDHEKDIPPNELETILTLPGELQSLSERTRSFLTKTFNNVSDISKENIKVCDLKECLFEAALDPSIEPHLKNILFVESVTDMKILGDREKIIQLLVNILENACHALELTKNPKINVKITGHAISITDNGDGIHETDIPNVFEEFFSTKSSTGQGLAFCKQVMSEHGGSIKCESQKGNFTRFELKFSPIKKGVFNA